MTTAPAHARPKPGRFAKLVVGYPVCVMGVTSFIAIVLAMLAFVAAEAELGGSFTDPTDKIVRQYAAAEQKVSLRCPLILSL